MADLAPCAKSANLVDVMSVVVKAVNYILSRSLNHRQFQSLMDEVENYGDLLYFSEMRWPNRGVLERCSADKSFSDYATPLPDSVDRTRAELRRAGYLTNPAERVTYLRGMGGDYLHPRPGEL